VEAKGEKSFSADLETKKKWRSSCQTEERGKRETPGLKTDKFSEGRNHW